MDRRLLTRVKLRNYKSIAACDVAPAQLSFLVGPNGSGKSNFLDALRFIADSLRFSIDHALRDRGGINEVRRRSGGHPTHFGIRVEFNLEDSQGHYSFRVGAKAGGGYEVQREECHVFQRGPLFQGGSDDQHYYYNVERGRVVKSNLSPPPVAAADRLYLVNVSGVEAFRPVYDALSGTGFYNLNPEAIRDLQQTDPGELLKRDGSNAASVLSNLGSRSSDFKKKIETYLGKVVPGVAGRPSSSARRSVEQSIPGGSSRATCPMGPCGRSACCSPYSKSPGVTNRIGGSSASKNQRSRFIPRPPASSSTVSGTRPSMHRSW